MKIGDRVTFRDFGVTYSGYVMTAREAEEEWAVKFYEPTDPDSLHVVTNAGQVWPLWFVLENPA